MANWHINHYQYPRNLMLSPFKFNVFTTSLEQQCVAASETPPVRERPFQTLKQAARSFPNQPADLTAAILPVAETETYFVERGEAVTVCAPHHHTTLKNQYSTGGGLCDGPWCLLTVQNYSKCRESTERGLEKNTEAEEVLTITSENRGRKNKKITDGGIRGGNIWRSIHTWFYRTPWFHLALHFRNSFFSFLQKMNTNTSQENMKHWMTWNFTLYDIYIM